MRVKYLPPVVYLARHATPDWNRHDIPYDVPPGPPLTEQGQREAAALGRYLQQQGVVKVYASPLERTLHTARIASEIAGARLIVAHEIAEWRRDEDEAAVLERVRGSWQCAADESQEIGPIALVTHGGCVLALLNYLRVDQGQISLYRNQFDHRNPLPPAGAWLTRQESFGLPWMAHLAFSPTPIQESLPHMTYV